AGALFQLPHVVGELRVLLGGHAQLLLPGGRLLGQRHHRDRQVEHVLDAVQQGQGRLRAGRVVRVVRHVDPEGQRVELRAYTSVVKDPDDAGGTLVAGGGEVELLGGGAAAGAAADRQGPGVWDVGEQGAEHHDAP